MARVPKIQSFDRHVLTDPQVQCCGILNSFSLGLPFIVFSLFVQAFAPGPIDVLHAGEAADTLACDFLY